MMGLFETFAYHKCINCGHAYLPAVPINMSEYYNTTEYYSFKKNTGFINKSVNDIKKLLQKILVKLKIKKSFLFSSSLQSLLSVKGLNKYSAILDYGCGAGQFVNELIAAGFKNTKGFDPYLPENKNHNGELYITNNLQSFKSTRWNIITLNHVFEHLENPVEVLKILNNLLGEGGKLILRFPVIDSFAFEKYREDWVQFDAPRHLNLFTRKSIQLAVEKAGKYKIVAMYDDSYHFQFTGSELYLKKLSLAPRNNNRIKRLLSLKTYQFHFLAKKLNKQQKGDQMAIILERI